MSAVPRPTIRPSSRRGSNCVAALRGDDVEVPVEVDEPLPRARAAAHDARVVAELDQLRREVEPRHRRVQHRAALAQPAAGRILGVDRDELHDQLGHLVGPCVEPGGKVVIYV